MHSDRLAEKTKHVAAFKTDCNWSCSWPEITELQQSTLLTISARTKVSKACRDRDRRTLRIWHRAAKHALATAVMWVLMDNGTCQRRCRPRGRGSKKLAARQWCQCGPDQTVSDVVDEKMCTRELQSWRDSAAADGMPSKPKPHRHRRNSSSRRRRKRSGIAGAGLSLIWPPHFTVTL